MLKEMARALLQSEPPKIEPDTLEKIINEVLQALSEVDCTLHPLGFVHFDVSKLVPNFVGAKTRLHLWDPRLSPGDNGGSIHDHTWHLSSVVLRGSLQNLNLRPVKTEQGHYSAVRVVYGDKNEFQDAGRYRLQPLDERILHEGDFYSIPSRIVHKSTLLSPTAITLLTATPDENASRMGPLILQESGSIIAGTPRRESVDQSRSAEVLRNLLPSNDN